MAFDHICYVGSYCEELSSILTEFVPGEDRPSIKHLCQLASQMGTWTALINADIVMSHKLKEVERRMDQQGIKCAVSHRFDLESGFIMDQGLDFFCGTQEVWKIVYGMIPSDFRIGFGAWDNLMIGAFVCQFGRRCADITREHLIYHPKHEDRLSPNWEGKGLSHKYVKQHYWPATILK